MSTIEMLLKDRRGRRLGTILVDRIENGSHRGWFVPDDWPTELRELFEEYDTLINDQVFSVLDEIEAKIDAHGLCVSRGGSESCDPITNVHITPNRRISFRLASVKNS